MRADQTIHTKFNNVKRMHTRGMKRFKIWSVIEYTQTPPRSTNCFQWCLRNRWMYCLSIFLAWTTEGGSLELANRKSKWWAPSLIFNTKMCSWGASCTPPPAHGSRSPLLKWIREGKWTFLATLFNQRRIFFLIPLKSYWVREGGIEKEKKIPHMC